ncbi:MAG: hypothetical protein DID90_2727554820 [Candidatus Nitrotoga sp. LAW]|nr:MAG: hypothetical protein DID90_2727554820 [Candidatus Nitrotoga sp. LAW]
MGIKGDWNEVADIWSRSPWRVRVLLGVSLFLASNSIATLSDTVFRWKGFIKDALSFYQQYVTVPLWSVIRELLPNIFIPPGTPHLIILSTLYIGTNLRIIYFSVPGSKPRRLASQSLKSYIGASIGMLAAMYYSEKLLDGGGALGLFIGSAAAASVSYIRSGGAARILWFIWLLSPFVAIGFTAAVNSGLARE